MNNPLVSIIVPVYNVQNSVARCLESICAQTWKDIEVILVNDGSRDPSLTRMTSISFHVWAQMLSRQRATLFCTLYTGTIMLTSGLFMTEGLLFTDIIPLY